MLFFSSFVNQMPMVHPHTWTLSRTPPLLIGAMQACGALYLKTRVANAFITSTLAQARDPLVAQFVRAGGFIAGIPLSPPYLQAKETATLSDRIYTILAVTLLQTLGLFHQHSEQRSTARTYHSMLVSVSLPLAPRLDYVNTSLQMIRRSGIMSEIAAWRAPDIDNVTDAALEEAWRDWAVIEMGKRCVDCCCNLKPF